MPYIHPEERERLREPLRELLHLIETPGELNYTICVLCSEARLDEPYDKLNYERLNAVVGVLECAKQEFYRRIVGPYEERKIIENGDML